MFRLVLTAAVLTVAFAFPISKDDPCGYPNNTANAFHFFDCSSTDPIQVQTMTITDDHNNANYPIDVHKPIVLKIHSQNNGAVYQKDTVDVHLYEYTSNWLTGGICKWWEIPTFGLLNGIDGCEFASNCPLTQGPLDLQIQLDLHAYSPIINLLASTKSYQIEVHMKNNNAGSQHEEIACVMAQLKFALD